MSSSEPKPDPPTDVKGISLNASIIIYWTAPEYSGTSPIITYKVVGSPGNHVVFTPSTITYVFSLENFETYTFHVIASNIHGDSDPSETISITPFTFLKPDPPTEVIAVGLAEKALISWIPPLFNGGIPHETTVMKYKIISVPGYQVTTTESTEAVVYNLTNDVNYRFFVYSNTFYSDSVAARDAVYAIPESVEPPVNVKIALDNKKVSVSWSKPIRQKTLPVTQYKVSLNRLNYSPVEVIVAANSNIIEYNYLFINLEPRAQYTVSVQASTGYDYSAPTSQMFVAVSVPDAPGNFRKITTVDGNELIVKLSWTSALTYYPNYPIINYYISSDPKGVYYQLKYNVFTQTVRIPALVDYTFYIYASNDFGYSPSGSVKISSKIIDPPVNISYTLEDKKVNVYWSKSEINNSELSHFQITLYPNNIIVQVPILSNQIDYQYSFTGLVPNTMYSVSVEAATEFETSESIEISFVAVSAPEAPKKVYKIIRNNYEGSYIRLFWNPAVTFANYPVLKYYVISSPPGVFLEVDGNITETVITGLSTQIEYNFYVVATNYLGESPYSEVSKYYPGETNPVLYNKLKTGGNDPQITKKMRYSQYLKSNLVYQAVNMGGGAGFVS